MALDRSAEGEVASTYCEAHGPKKYAAPPRNKGLHTRIGRALNLIAPWANTDRHGLKRYPGRYAIWRETIGSHVTLEAIQQWRYGRVKAPAWAIDLITNELRRTGLERLRAADELQKERGAG